MTNVAIDIALNKTGIAVLNEDGDFLYGKLITVTASWGYYRKLETLYQEYLDFFDKLLTESSDSVILLLEGRLKAGFRRDALASIEGARVTCVLAYKHACGKHGKKPEIHTYDPNDIKYSLAGKRNASKEEMRDKVLSSYSWLRNVEYQEDIYDAIYIMLHHMKKEKDERTTKNSKKS